MNSFGWGNSEKSDNIFYNNYLIDNTIYNAYWINHSIYPNYDINQWDNGIDTGNYYSNHNDPSEGCTDIDGNGRCDSSYDIPGGVVSSNVDRYPIAVPKLKTISVSPYTASLDVGDTQTFTATTKDQFDNSIVAAVTWSSSDTNVGIINPSTGEFTAKAAGTTTVSATNGSVSGTAAVTVSTSTPLGIESSTGKGMVYFESNKGNIENLVAVNVDDIPEPPPVGTVHAFYGAFRFNITGIAIGDEITMTLTFPRDISHLSAYWKYGKESTNPTPHWYPLPSSVDGNKLTFTIVEGGLGDDDLTANGRIEDDGAPSIPQSQKEIPEFPTISLPIVTVLGILFLLRKPRI